MSLRRQRENAGPKDAWSALHLQPWKEIDLRPLDLT